MASEPIFVDSPRWSWGAVVDACRDGSGRILVEYQGGRLEVVEHNGDVCCDDLMGVDAVEVPRTVRDVEYRTAERRDRLRLGSLESRRAEYRLKSRRLGLA